MTEVAIDHETSALKAPGRPWGRSGQGTVMKFQRRQILHLTAGAVALPFVARIARAATYPTRTVQIIVPFAPGITPDITARLIAQSLSERLGQPFVVDNRPGADGNVGTEIVVRAAPDGYTLLLATLANASNATLYDKLSFDFIRDVAPVAGISRGPLVMEVHPSVPAKTVPEFIAYAKANPGKVNMASGGNGSPQHVAGELFAMLTGIDLVHIPYRGNPTPDLLSGQVQVYFGPIPGSIGYIRTDKLRALAVTGATRLQALPDIPTVAEFVPGYEAGSWYGFGAPKGTPAELIEKLNVETNAALADPVMKARLVELGAEPIAMTPTGFGKFIANETDKWGKVVRFAGVKVD
jgi:tripartite-type tricarboxylate transporter receptor subunit TctC